jgi:hypothetical protein
MPKKSDKLTVTIESPTERKRNAPRTAYSKENPSPHSFASGVSGNPGGKPMHHRLLTRALRARLDTRAPDKVAQALGLPRRASYAQVLSATLVNHALRGDMNAVRTIFEYTEGAPKQSLALGFDPDFDDADEAGPRLVVQFVSPEYQELTQVGLCPASEVRPELLPSATD